MHPPQIAPATLLVAIHPSIATNEAGLAELVVHTLIPMLDDLEARPAAKLAWHMGGNLLDHLARHHEGFLLRLKPFVERHQIEILGGPFYGGIPALLSEADVRGQTAMAAEFWESIVGVAPEGCMLPEMAWAAELPRLLQDTGVAYGVVSDAQLTFGQAVCPGWGRLERGGHSMFALCIDSGLSALFAHEPSEAFASKWAARARGAGAAPISIVVQGEALGPLANRGAHTRLAELLDALSQEGMALQLPKSLLTATGLAEPVVLSREYAPLVAKPSYRQAGRVSLAPPEEAMVPSQLGQWAQSHITSWAEFPARFAAADALYRRMLRVSERLQRAIERMEDEGLDDAWSGQLATAQRAVFRAQASEGFGAGRLQGFVEPAVRDATLRAICSAEHQLNGLMGATDASGEAAFGEQATLVGELMDEELFVAASGQLAWVSPKRGTLRSLEPEGQQRNLLDAWTEADLMATADAQGLGGGIGDVLTASAPVSAQADSAQVPSFCGPWHPHRLDADAQMPSAPGQPPARAVEVEWVGQAQLPGEAAVALTKRIAVLATGVGLDWHIQAKPAAKSQARYALHIPLRPSASPATLEIDQAHVAEGRGTRSQFGRVRVLAEGAEPISIVCEPASGWRLSWQPGVGGQFAPDNGGIVLTLSREVDDGFAATVSVRA